MKYSKYFWTDKYLTNHVHHILCSEIKIKKTKPKSQGFFTTTQYLSFASVCFIARHLRRPLMQWN